MHQALDATIDEHGHVTLLEELVLPSPRKAVVVVLNDAPAAKVENKRLPTLADLGEPKNEWERRLRAIGVPAGVSLTDEQLSREEMYD